MEKKSLPKIICRVPNEPYENLKSINTVELISSLLNDKKYLYSIYIASPSLYEIIINKKPQELTENLIITLIKYYIRFCYRSIPFGIFSSTSILCNQNFSENILIKSFYTKTTLDFKYFKNNLFNEEKDINSLKFNPSIRINNDKITYVESLFNLNGEKSFSYTSIDKGPIENDDVEDYDFSRVNSRLLNEGYNEDEIKEYQKELIENGVIINRYSLASIHDCNQQRIYSKSLSSKPINDILQIADNLDYEKMLDSINSFKKSSIEEKNVLNVNSFFKTETQLSKNQIKTSKKAFEVLNKIDAKFSKNVRLKIENFIDKFAQKYENEAILLLEVFDTELGIDYTLIDNSFDNNIDDHIEESLFKIIDEANNAKASFVKINDSFLNNIKDNESPNKTKNPLDCIRINLYKDISAKDICYISTNSRRTPIELISRFTHINDEYLELSKEIAEYEQSCYSETILAEIDYLPHVNSGNLIRRGKFRKYTIKIDNEVLSEYDIPLNDLYLQYISGKLVLFSKKLQRNILPCFSNAFDYRYQSFNPIVRFLIEFADLDLGIGSILPIPSYHKYYKRIPRIMYNDNIILSKESWIIRVHDLFDSHQLKEKDIPNSVINNFYDKKEILGLPDKFEIVNNDIVTFIDTSNILMLKIFLKDLKNNLFLYVKEVLLEAYEGIVKSEKGTHNGEFFMFLENPHFKDSTSVIISKKQQSNISINRKFLPGSQWLYYKIYLKQEYCNKFIKNISSLLFDLMSNKEIISFFYIKFYDPDFHIRLRFKINPIDYIHLITKINQFLSPLVIEKYISNVEISTYNREIERYSAENMEIIEDVFYIDSLLSINNLTTSFAKYNTNYWITSIRIIKEYLLLFFYTEEERVLFTKNMIDVLKNELDIQKTTTVSINKLYKDLKPSLNDIYNKNTQNPLYEVLNEHIAKLDFTKFSREYYAGNLIHMHITRIVNINNKYSEYVLYNFYLKLLYEDIFKK